MLITAIEPRRKSLSALFLDGEFAMNLDTETLLRSGWKLGDEIGDEALFELKTASEARRANEKALYLLGCRGYAKKELAERLRRSVTPQAAEQAAARMEELGLVDDEAFAENLAAELLERKGFSAERACYELRRKGVEQELAERVVGALAPDPAEKIGQLLAQKYPGAAEDEKRRRRAFAALQRLGYRSEDIRRALRELGGNTDDYEDE